MVRSAEAAAERAIQERAMVILSARETGSVCERDLEPCRTGCCPASGGPIARGPEPLGEEHAAAAFCGNRGKLRSRRLPDSVDRRRIRDPDVLMPALGPPDCRRTVPKPPPG